MSRKTDDHHKAHVGQLLVRLRKERRWTQLQAAQEMGVGERQWQKWEHGVSLPRIATRKRLAALFKVDEAEFYPAVPERTADLGALQGEVAELRARVDALEGKADVVPEISAGLRKSADAREGVQDPPVDIRDRGAHRKSKGGGRGGR